MTGPITTCTVPAFLRKAYRPQNSPALCAMGMMGVPVRVASVAPPMP
jgi:hypothetical protein